ncbi:MAG: dTDP-glucose 4,6-dehydratase [Caulobacteraceae bacterium]|nr:dTDP-glucose 4,6-dehydratase [Caulobacteraceae bacterium]
MKILITGGAGFIGSNFIIYMLNKYPSYKIINYDALTYAANIKNLDEIKNNKNHEFIQGNILDKKKVQESIKNCNVIINFAAESHVDNSIANSSPFIQTNIVGTHNLLECAKEKGIDKFIQISTDEVYGSIDEGLFTESSLIQPNSPYSASKAAADHLVKAYYETWGLNINITRCSNNYGPNQHDEKLIPKIIKNAINDLPIPIYGNGLNVRDWLHVEDHCQAIDLILHNGNPGEVYNIGGNNEWKNIDIVKKILKELNKSESLIKFVDDRLGHDTRYAINAEKIKKELNWNSKYDFNEGMLKIINWYKEKYKC